MISKENLKKLVEPHFHKNLQKESYKIISKQAIDLLTYTRFDLAFKLFYLDMKNKNEMLAEEIYLEHIRAFSLGKFTEPGNKKKRGEKKFIEKFNETYESIKKYGHDNNQTVIPLSQNGSIVNGAHRVASAIYLNKNIFCVKIDVADDIYDYNFFYQRNVPIDILDMVSNVFIKYSNNVYIAFIGPIGVKKEKEIEKTIPCIVYKKTIKLTPNGVHNLISQIYYEKKNPGNTENNFRTANVKPIECFKPFEKFTIYAFQAENLDKVSKIGKDIKELCNVGKHSVYITNNKEKTMQAARIVFNNNSLHFLNFAKPNRFLSNHIKIKNFKKFIRANSVDYQDVLIGSGMVLSCYGIREAKNMDFFCNDNPNIKNKLKNANIHNNKLKYYQKEKKDMIYDARNYFYFQDLKFISLNLIFIMKKNRNKKKDENDCEMIEALKKNNRLLVIINKLEQHLLYLRAKIRQNIIGLLHTLGLFLILKKIYKKVFK